LGSISYRRNRKYSLPGVGASILLPGRREGCVVDRILSKRLNGKCLSYRDI